MQNDDLGATHSIIKTKPITISLDPYTTEDESDDSDLSEVETSSTLICDKFEKKTEVLGDLQKIEEGHETMSDIYH